MDEVPDDNPDVLSRYTVLLKDGETTATIYPVSEVEEVPEGLLEFLWEEFNMEIDQGVSVPFYEPMQFEEFQEYWFQGGTVGFMVLGSDPELTGPRQWERECLGSFFIGAKYGARCGHICTGDFLVNAGIRGKGIGRTLADCYLQWAPRLGFTFSMFDMVFETNVAARRIWDQFGFKQLGKIRGAAVVRNHDQPVAGLILGKDISMPVSPSDPRASRHEKIRYYLLTGGYPANATRQEKSSLRSGASHYEMDGDKLMFKGKEVITDKMRQLDIASRFHLQSNHGGINRTTSFVSEQYHWSGIKETATVAVKNCRTCNKRIQGPHTPTNFTHGVGKPPHSRTPHTNLHSIFGGFQHPPASRTSSSAVEVDLALINVLNRAAGSHQSLDMSPARPASSPAAASTVPDTHNFPTPASVMTVRIDSQRNEDDDDDDEEDEDYTPATDDALRSRSSPSND
ncbi:hypothetical protein DICA0_C10352 [Diutina catenulata]